MWFNILPAYLIVAASVAFPGYTLWWCHYFVLGNIVSDYALPVPLILISLMKPWPHSFFWQDFDSISGNTQLTVIRITKLFLLYLFLYFAKMWYEILPSAFIITAALGLPGWGLYHIHNLTLGNHFRRSLDDRWDRQLYQRDLRLTGNPYKVAGLEDVPEN